MAPSMFPQAKFDPIPPDLDLHGLVDRTPNFEWVLRLSASQIRNIGQQEFEKLVSYHVIQGGKPLVIEKWNDRLPKSFFSAQWLEATYDKKQENVRDITGQTDIPMTVGHYLRSMKQLANQWTPTNFRDERRQRLYLKDIDCPVEWSDFLRKVMPANLFYMNENVEDRGDRKQGGDQELFVDQEVRTVAPAGDLMSSLPEAMRAQNLMCYVGHEGTFTPAHREMCASLGQNIMVEASGDENGEKAGSSIWFMTESKDREVVREYFLSMLGHDVEIEKHFAQINAWKKATFPVYIVEQKVGDFILVPPLAPHQVWNRGTRTMKVAWNRTTVETLQLALQEALPKARLVCRDEQYKNKAIIYYTLKKYFHDMVEAENSTSEMALLGIGPELLKNSPRMKQLARDFKALFAMFTEIMVGEMFATKEKDVELIEFDSNITCSYCRANIFNRFLTCKHCVRVLQNGDEDTYDVCMDCYAMGRSCLCISDLSWCEQWSWSDLVDSYDAWRSRIIKNEGYIDLEISPMPLEIARRKYSRKAIAQICQEQLRRRPFNDITKVSQPAEPESEPEVDEEGKLKKKKGRKKKKGDVYRCHVCSHKDYTYRLAFCSTPGCTDAYCYGVLYRAFDLMPEMVMQNENWKCPRCLNICNCGSCRRQGLGEPYTPKNTLLGHDTRPIADDRSVESLVDFRVHNLQWLKNVGDESRSLHSKRMQKLKQAADAAKAKETELVNEAAGLVGAEVVENGDAHMQQPTINGYGDQSDITGPEYVVRAQPEVNGSLVDPQLSRTNGQAGSAEVADVSLTQDMSSYPDPSMMSHERMLGMGYYEQDDSPDRILFDPYQAPTVETVAAVVGEPEPSEYVKKLFRASKRRARQDGDNDPDFAAPRSHQRKRPRLETTPQVGQQQEALDNMDPALFNESSIVHNAPTESTIGILQEALADREPLPVTDSTGTDGADDNGRNDHRPYSPNRPTLRHARPKASYAEGGDGEEELSDVAVPRSEHPPEGITDFDPENVNRDPLDLASAAVRALAMPEAVSSQPQPAPKKRGLGRPRKSEPTRSRPVKESSTPRLKGRRGRPPRADDADVGRAPTEEEATIGTEDDLEAQLARELEAFDDEGNIIEQTISSEPPVPSPPPKRRGGQPKVQTGPASAATVTVDLPAARPLPRPADMQFLSMAERMKLRGKKVKIVARQSGSPTTKSKPSSTSASPAAKMPGRSENIDDDLADEAKEELFSPSTSRRSKPSSFQPAPAVTMTVISETMDQCFDSQVGGEPFSSPAQGGSAMELDSPVGKPTPAVNLKPPATVLPVPVPLPARAPSPIPPPKMAGPTIIRLGDIDSDSGFEHYSADEDISSASMRIDNDGTGKSSSGSDFDDEDIPARKTSTPSRGVAARGRGGTRARGRGRGRGRARRGYH